MPQCVHLTNTLTFSSVARHYAETFVTVSQQDLASCSTYVLVTPAEYNAMQVGDIWAFDPIQSGKFFGFSFTLILSVYLVAWGYGQLLDFVRR